MYYYANIDLETGVCIVVEECEEPWYEGMEGYIPLDDYYKDYEGRKKYVNGEWLDTTPQEAARVALRGEIVAVGGEWLDIVLNNKADTNHTHECYATTDHTHTGYVSSDDLQALEDVVDTKADATHTHSGYATENHTHDGYATQVALDELGEEVGGKADASHSHSEYALSTHEHTNYAEVGHDHDSTYAPLSHSHTDYVTTANFEALESEVDDKASSTHTHTASEIGAAVSGHNHDSDYADINHNHDSEYSALSHSHTNYATTTDFNALEAEVEEKANVNHNHSNYSETTHNHDSEYSSVEHNHDEEYSPIGHSHADYATVTSVNELTTTVSGKADASDLNSHTNNAEIHVTDAERESWNAKSNFSGNYNDLTNKPSIPSINGLATEDYVDEKVVGITVESIGALPNTTVIPTVPTNVSAFTNDAGYLTEHQSLNGLATETYVDAQIDAIDIPSALSDLTTDSTHRVVTDAEKTAWNAKSNFSGSYNDLTDKPTIPSISGLATETYVDEAISGKANSSHTHTIANVSGLQSALNAKADSSHNHTGVYDVNGTAASALSSANTYTDEAIDALSETVATKAASSALTSHTGNTTVHISSTERTNWNAAKTHADSAHAPVNAEPNQNAFSNVVVGGTTISADTKTDTLTLVAGNNVTITPDSTGDSITISSANTVYTHPTSAGNKHIPAGGSSGQILRWSADGTAVWGNDNNTTYSNATQTASGLMSNTDKTKLDGIAEGANNYTLPSAGSALGGVKSGGDVTISGGLITVNDDSHNHVISNVDGLQSALDAKAASGHTHGDIYYTETEVDTLLEGKANASHTHTIANVSGLQSALDGKAATSHGTHVSYSTTAPVMDGSASVGTASTVARSDHKHPTDTSRAAQTSLDSHTGNKSNPHGVTLAQLGVTATAAELNYVDGVTSNVQTQLNGKAASGHTHGAATTSAAGFMTAAMVTKLNGIATGANAYSHPTYTARTGVPTANQTPAFGGTFTVSQPVSDGTGHITAVNSRTITIPSAVATASANGLMSKSDKSKLDGMVLATVSEVETYLAI